MQARQRQELLRVSAEISRTLLEIDAGIEDRAVLAEQVVADVVLLESTSA